MRTIPLVLPMRWSSCWRTLCLRAISLLLRDRFGAAIPQLPMQKRYLYASFHSSYLTPIIEVLEHKKTEHHCLLYLSDQQRYSASLIIKQHFSYKWNTTRRIHRAPRSSGNNHPAPPCACGTYSLPRSNSQYDQCRCSSSLPT